MLEHSVLGAWLRLMGLVFVLLWAGLAPLPAQVPIDLLQPEDAPPLSPIRVDGVVRGPDGPASNVEVLLEVSDMRIRRQVDYVRARTDMAGEFRFDLQKYARIPRLGLQFNTISPRYREALKIIVVTQQELPAKVELEVKPGTSALGMVKDDAGNPIEGATVSGSGLRSVRSDARGEFQINGLNAEGETTLRVSKAGYASAETVVSSIKPELIEGIEVVLRQADPLVGFVKTPRGEPISAAVVVLLAGDAFQRRETDSLGEFVFPNAPTNLDGGVLDVRAAGWLRTRHELSGEEITSRTATVLMRPGVAFAGEVRTADGRPAAGARIVFGDDRTAPVVPISADLQGRWRSQPLEPGTSTTVAVIPTGAAARRDSGELSVNRELEPGVWEGDVKPWPKGYESTFRIRFEDGGRVVMERRDEGAAGMPGVITYEGTLSADGSTIEGKVTAPEIGAEGTFSATKYERTRTPRGMWDLREQFTAGRVAGSPVERVLMTGLLPGTRRISITVDQPLAVSGVVNRADGTPLTRGSVMVLDWQGRNMTRITADLAAGGEFRLDGVPAGVFRIIAVGEDNEASEPRYVLGGAEGLELIIGAEPLDPMEAAAE